MDLQDTQHCMSGRGAIPPRSTTCARVIAAKIFGGGNWLHNPWHWRDILRENVVLETCTLFVLSGSSAS